MVVNIKISLKNSVDGSIGKSQEGFTVVYCALKNAYTLVSLRPLSIRSPRVRTQTFSPYTCQIYTIMFRIVLGFVLLCKLARMTLPDLLPVRQAGDLPPASFRFAVAHDTLAFG